MYGFVHCAWSDMVVSQHGEETWNRVLKESGLEMDGGSFLIHRMYDDDTTHRLMMATSRVIGVDVATCMQDYGEYFYKYCIESGYDRVLKVLGNNLLDFLCNLDALHDHFDSAYPGMRAPSFRCNSTDSGGLMLHYYSERSGLYPMVIGIVKAIAKGLFDTEVIIEPTNRREAEELPLLPTKQKRCISLAIREDSPFGLSTRKRSSSLVSTLARYRNSTRPKDLPISVRTFCKAFPFHLMFNRSLEITQAGSYLMRTLQIPHGVTVMFSDYFSVLRPIIEFGFNAVLGHINTVFVINTKETSCARKLSIRMKGQMVFVPESDSILFLGSPRLSCMDDMRSQGILLSDIPLHDSTRDLILVTQARKHERELVEKLEETSNNLKRLQCKLEEDKGKTDQLLHSILPSSVAEKLRLNLPVEAEKFTLVTILFSDIVGFTSMCGDEKVVPIDIVRMLNRLYTQFDMLSSLNSVYKVETIGDAYMAVGGLPAPTDHHGDHVISMAFGMIAVSKTVLSPVDGKSIQIRIGIHSGPCVAGVVGQKMPRYCLFGRTVTIANKMESCGRPGRINISEHAKSHLSNPECFLFEENLSAHDQTPCRSYFISQTSCSPQPLTVDLSLPVPRGMFRTPNPTPPGSRAATPCTPPSDSFLPISPTSTERSLHFKFKNPTIRVSSVDMDDDRKRCDITNAEEEIRRKLKAVPSVRCFYNQDIQGSFGNANGICLSPGKDSLCLRIPQVKLTKCPGVEEEKGIQEVEEMERRRKRSQDQRPASAVDSLMHERSLSPSLISPSEVFLVPDCRRKSDSAVANGLVSSSSLAEISLEGARSTGFLNGTSVSFTKRELAEIRDRGKLVFYFRSRSRSRSRSSKPTAV